MSDESTIELFRQLAAQLAPGPMNLNTLVRTGIAGHVHANFDRVQGGQNVDPTNANKRTMRLVRPGAIILANLDIDENPGVARARFQHSAEDKDDNVINWSPDDDQEVTQFIIGEPALSLGNATRVSLRIDPIDQNRIRVWRVSPAAPANLQAGPPNVQVVIGPGVSATYEIANTAQPAPAPLVPWAPPWIPAPGWQEKFVVEALTLPGDPRHLPAGPRYLPPGGPAVAAPPVPPGAPGPFRSPVGATSGGSESAPVVNATNPANPVYAAHAHYGNRAPGDIWVEVVHEVGAAVGAAVGPGVANLRDVGLFTIAPWIMTWNTLPVERLYVCYMIGAARPPVFGNALFENHAMVWDLWAGCNAAGLTPVAPAANTQTLHPTHSSAQIHTRADVPFFIIPPPHLAPAAPLANAHNGTDRWIQDEIETGYCWAPHKWMSVVLHIPRNRELRSFVRTGMAAPGLGVFEPVSAAYAANAGWGQDCGGNLEVSPPVPSATPAIPRNARSGPAVKSHRAAPFGKILTGDMHTPAIAGHGTLRPRFHNFLVAQHVQPVLPLETTWLEVGHVDEILSFVRATGPRGFKLLFCSVRLMTILLEEIRGALAAPIANGLTLHAGKYNQHLEYAETFVEEWVGPAAGPSPPIRRYSETVERERLTPILNRLRVGLDLSDEMIISMPTYWKVPAGAFPPAAALGVNPNRTIAESVGTVNMQVVGNHLMVPKPHGPRIPRADAERVVTRVLERWFGASLAPPVSMPPAGTFNFWARPNESVEALALYFSLPPGGFAATTRAWRWQVMNVIGARHPAGMAPRAGSAGAGIAGGGNMHGAPLQTDYNNVALLPAPDRVAINAFAAGIRGSNIGLPAAFAAFPEWRRVRIPDQGLVDVFEVYLKSVLENLGNTVHFIENFECYHEMSGEVHCGTNVVRSPPELEGGFTARWWDPGVYDPTYDTSYDPAN